MLSMIGGRWRRFVRGWRKGEGLVDTRGWREFVQAGLGIASQIDRCFELRYTVMILEQ